MLLLKDKPITYAITERQWEVLELLKDGKTYKEVAEELCITCSTVSWHINHILERSGSRNIIEAINFYYNLTLKSDYSNIRPVKKATKCDFVFGRRHQS